MDKIDSIDIVLENCEVYRIPSENVLFLSLDKIYSSAFVNYAGQYTEFKTADYCLLKVKNSDYITSFEEKHIVSMAPKGFIQRMQNRDIVAISVHNDNIKHIFYVASKNRYGEASWLYENLWQINSITPEEISIEIKKRDS